MAEGKAKAKQRKKAKPATRQPLSPATKVVFLILTISFPFLLLGTLEAGLRMAGYGGDMSAFDTPPILRGAYKVPGQGVGRRYFPQERFPPSPPADAFRVNKPASSMRIFVLGESSAAGFPYSGNGTFSRVLRDALTDVLPDDTVEVVNMGMAATNSFTIADLADEIIAEKPDAVMIYGGHNEYYGALGAGSTESLGSVPALVRLYLRLQHLRTFLLLRNGVTNVLVALKGGRRAGDLEGDATRMESVVGDQRITLGGATYERGVRQYESNLRAAVDAFRAAEIAVFIGSTPGNIRSLSPFSISAVPPDSAAKRVFDSAATALKRGDSVEAAATFARARDLDMIRFRAPGEFQTVVERVARETGSTYVPVLEEISGESRFGIPGDDLFLEHVHLNQRGYVLIARAFYDALARQKFLGRAADTSRFAGWTVYTGRMRLTDLDHRIAHHTVRTITTRWPFMPVSQQLDYRGTYQPRNLLDSIAFNASRGGMSWAQAKGMIAAHYAGTGETERAVAEYEGLIRDGPEVEVAYRLAGRTLLAANLPERARPYLEKAYSISPTGLTAYALGVFAMQEKNPERGIALFQQALHLTPDMPQALYQLSLAYGTTRNLQGARTTAARLAQVEPRFPGLAEWLSALGMNPQ